jgi:hypothetical protein
MPDRVARERRKAMGGTRTSANMRRRVFVEHDEAAVSERKANRATLEM